jgi:hypothetical protein
MTIVDSAATVLREARRPMTAPEIYAAILERKLFQFKAKQPIQVLIKQLRRHCVGVENADSSASKVFARQDEAHYTLASASTPR